MIAVGGDQPGWEGQQGPRCDDGVSPRGRAGDVRLSAVGLADRRFVASLTEPVSWSHFPASSEGAQHFLAIKYVIKLHTLASSDVTLLHTNGLQFSVDSPVFQTGDM